MVQTCTYLDGGLRGLPCEMQILLVFGQCWWSPDFSVLDKWRFKCDGFVSKSITASQNNWQGCRLFFVNLSKALYLFAHAWSISLTEFWWDGNSKALLPVTFARDDLLLKGRKDYKLLTYRLFLDSLLLKFSRIGAMHLKCTHFLHCIWEEGELSEADIWNPSKIKQTN